MTHRPRVIIVGAGFGGLHAAKGLRHAPVDVLLIDRNNFHTFQPLLYQVATAALDSGDVAHQVRDIFRSQKNLRFRQATVVGVDQGAKEVVLEGGGRERYAYLVVAAGAVYDDFGVPGVRDHAFVLKSLERAGALRSHILKQFERAAADPSLIEKGALTFVIVGAGPTGVEMAGAMVELFDRVLPADYPELDLRLARVVLVEATGAVLPPFQEASQRFTERVLRRRGVDVRLNSVVAEAKEGAVVLRSGEVIPTRTLIWAAGVRAHPLVDVLGAELTRGSRVAVEPDLSLPDRPDTFAIGDLSGATDEQGKPYPQVAQVAIQGGKHVARTILRRLQDRPGEPFRYVDLGSMAIVGRNAGVAELSRRYFGVKMRGFLGWLAWLFLHLIYLPGFRNRFSALFSWAYEYLTYDRHARLILEPTGGTTWAPPKTASAPAKAEAATDRSNAEDADTVTTWQEPRTETTSDPTTEPTQDPDGPTTSPAYERSSTPPSGQHAKPPASNSRSAGPTSISERSRATSTP